MRWRRWILCLLAAAAPAQDEREPGLVPTDLVSLEELTVPPRPGDAREALATFVAAHQKQKRGDRAGALQGYLAFLGMPGRHVLPRRYLATVRRRVEALRAEVRARYDKALALYERDRRNGLAALSAIAERHAMLPEGRAARALVHSDALREAIDRARALAREGKGKAAAVALEQAVRTCEAAQYLYEAKSLLLELGGPDLFAPGERIGTARKEDDEGPGIEVSDD
ncbi:MAG: hypothetical protein ACYTEZ_03415 [Planctomycetota bacterium]